jgi:hypothetical protein
MQVKAEKTIKDTEASESEMLPFPYQESKR